MKKEDVFPICTPRNFTSNAVGFLGAPHRYHFFLLLPYAHFLCNCQNAAFLSAYFSEAFKNTCHFAHLQ